MMKKKIFLGIMSLAMGLFSVSCEEDDDYSIATGQLTQGITTGSSDVTANSAVLYATVEGLQNQSSSAYEVGFYYGSATGNLSNKVMGSLNNETVTASLGNLVNNQSIYYKAYVKLQGIIEYVGEEKSLVTTNAKIETADAASIMPFSVSLGGNVSDYQDASDITCGVVIAAVSDEEIVRAGLDIAATEVSDNFSISAKGLLPNKTYYYAAYLNLGASTIYGEVKSFTTEKYEPVNDELVDLGLSVKWYKYNLGTSEISEYGGYFAYGNMTGCSNSTSISDYNPAVDIYGTEYDVASSFSEFMTIPTASQFEELFTLCTKEWTTENGVAGYKFTGPNGNTLFLPAAGQRIGSTVNDEGELGMYLTGSINPTNSEFAISYEFGEGESAKSTSPRYAALSIRPVSLGIGYRTSMTVSDGSAWPSVSTLVLPEAGKQYTLTYNGASSIGGVYLIDIVDLATDYPNAIVRVDDIKIDGNSIKYDANKFYYGNIEGEGKYRIELFNMWGSTSSDSPFRKTTESKLSSGESALAFNTSFEVTFTIASLDQDVTSLQYPVHFYSMQEDWNTLSSADVEGYVAVNYENFQYSISPSSTLSYSLVYSGASASARTLYVQIDKLGTFFPKIDATVTAVKADNVSETADLSKVAIGQDGGNAQITLINQWNENLCDGNGPFADAPKDIYTGLVYNSSLEIDFTVNHLFAVPDWD